MTKFRYSGKDKKFAQRFSGGGSAGAYSWDDAGNITVDPIADEAQKRLDARKKKTPDEIFDEEEARAAGKKHGELMGKFGDFQE
jgi:hypothetical protein